MSRAKATVVLIVILFFGVGFLGVLFIYAFIYVLLIKIIESPVLESEPFIIISLFLTAIVFGSIVVKLLLFYLRTRGSEGLRNILSEAIDSAKEMEKNE